jgi:uncharacterized protein YutE (UPF0331/DUF86 family)
MSNKTIIENKISAIKKYLKIAAGYKKYAQKKLEGDASLRGAVERYLYLAAQATIDLAEAVIAYKNFRKPQTMSESFEILKEEDIINAELSQEMIKMVGFRNVMAHDYERVNYAIVYNVLQNGAEDIEKFIKVVKKKLI